ncbi:uncharacterized protein LOC141898988 [Tubulanus polymorphus]|uniref:uncharacterized protein LOC141898988 n=1 Tax=Tubulanus polymorphus TaxID=672921 RepID=UPI003DA3C256
MAPVPISDEVKQVIQIFVDILLPTEPMKLLYRKFQKVCDSCCTFSTCNSSVIDIANIKDRSFSLAASGSADDNNTRVSFGMFFNSLFRPGIEALKRVKDSGHYDSETQPEIDQLVKYITENKIASYCYKTGDAKKSGRPTGDNEDLAKIGEANEKLRFCDVKNKCYEYDLKCVLLTHLLKKLIPDCSIAVMTDEMESIGKTMRNPHAENEFLCSCGCGGRIFTDKTSIGHQEVFHGRVDAIIGKTAIQMTLEVPDPDDEGVDEDTAFEFKKGTILNVDTIEQGAATAVVFSFLKAKEKGHFIVAYNEKQRLKCYLTPTILISESKYIIMFYDAVNDLFLASNEEIFWHQTLRIKDFFYLWLALNYEKTMMTVYGTDTCEKVNYLRSGFHEKTCNLDKYYEVEYGVEFKEPMSNLTEIFMNPISDIISVLH